MAPKAKADKKPAAAKTTKAAAKKGGKKRAKVRVLRQAPGRVLNAGRPGRAAPRRVRR